MLTPKGAPVEGLFVVLSGHIAIFIDRGAGPHKVMEWRAGDVAGMLPYSRLVTPPGDRWRRSRSEVLAVPRDDITAMIRDCHEMTSILVHKMLDRARDFTSSGLHDEKMISLGKLSAGLAHELNNPASAIERSAALLETGWTTPSRRPARWARRELTRAQVAAIDAVRDACLADARSGVLSPIQQAEREDAHRRLARGSRPRRGHCRKRSRRPR